MMAKAKPKAKAKPFGTCCGLNEAGINDWLTEIEGRDRGTTRYPWPDGLRDGIKAGIDGMTHMPAVKAKINAMVMDAAGPGLFGRGPFEERELK